jgi:hypothetical protein
MQHLKNLGITEEFHPENIPVSSKISNKVPVETNETIKTAKKIRIFSRLHPLSTSYV